MAIAEVGAGSQRATVRGNSVDSANGVFGGNVTAGSLLTVQAACWQSVAATGCTVTDTRSTSYTVKFGPTGTSTTQREWIAYGLAPTSGACTVTVDPSGTGNYINGVVDEFSGVDGTTPLDVDGGESTGADTTPTDSLTTASANALVLAVGQTVSATTWSAGSGYTLQDNDNTGARIAYAAEFQIVGAAGSYSATFTKTDTNAWAVYTAGFKEAAVVTDTGFSGWPIFRPKLWSY